MGSENIEIAINGGNISVDDANALLSSNIDIATDTIITLSADVAELSTNSPSVDAFINGESIYASLTEFSIWEGIEELGRTIRSSIKTQGQTFYLLMIQALDE